MQDFPEIIQKYWYAIDWDVEMIWKLDLLVETIPINELIWHMDVPVWPDEAGRKYSVTPRTVLDNPDEHPGEAQRIAAASLRYPLDVYRTPDRLMILDGVHRLAKASSEGLEFVRVRRVPDSAVWKIGPVNPGPQA